jgi:hypothetical protein
MRRERPKYLIGGNMMESPTIEPTSLIPDKPCRFEQGERANQVCLYERRRAKDGAVHMAFGGKVDESIYPMLAKYVFDQHPVTDIPLYEGVTRWVR